MESIEKIIEQTVQTATENKDSQTRIVKVLNPESKLNKNGEMEAIRQGDIYITRLDGMPQGNHKLFGSRQLAEGNTKGSRHVIREQSDVKIYSPEGMNINDAGDFVGSVLQGPVIDAPNGFYLEHPDHGDIDMRQGGVFRITYQRTFSHEQEIMRAKD